MGKRKRFKYVPIYREWAQELSGSDLLVYAYICHAIEISNYEIKSCSVTLSFATISREEIADFWQINVASVSRAITNLKSHYYIQNFKDPDNQRKYNYVLVPFKYNEQTRREWVGDYG